MGGNYFSVPEDSVWNIATSTNSMQCVSAFLVLCRHVQAKTCITTAGAPAIAKHLGITRYKAEEILGRLQKVGCGDDVYGRVVVDTEHWNQITEERATNFHKIVPNKSCAPWEREAYVPPKHTPRRHVGQCQLAAPQNTGPPS
jgi:hypothetical protein